MSYITVADIRAAGLSSVSVDDATVTAAIALWQNIIEDYCGQWFESRAGDFTLDGTDSDTLHLDFPIITVTALYANNNDVAVDPSYYRVYNGCQRPNDDRRNPRIKFVSPDDGYSSIYTAPDGWCRFRKGRQNQRIVGTFGFTEYDGSTPLPIKRALTKLTIQKLATPIYTDINNPSPSAPMALPPLTNSGVVTDEWTDWHRLKFQDINATLPKRADGMTDVIADPEVRGILKLYRRPLSMSAPANPTWKS
jgi:hypothetical protein